MKVSIRFVPIFAVISAMGVGCSSSSSTNNNQQPAATEDVHALYNADVAGFASMDTQASAQYDSENGHLFTEVFGGTDVASIQNYYSQRIHYAFSDDDLNNATMSPDPASFHYSGWETDPTNSPPPQSSNPSQKVLTGALNIGTGLWLDGVLNSTPVTIVVGSQVIPIDSTRVGIMMFGAGYTSTQTDDEGDVINLPTEYRQSILVHEARHSDCTGGLPENEIQIMRNASTEEDFLKQVPLPHCGHTHITCLSGTYKGYAACDAERYGAYKIGAIYEEAMILGETDYNAKSILRITAADFESRFISTGSNAPDELRPNMTSAGVTP